MWETFYPGFYDVIIWRTGTCCEQMALLCPLVLLHYNFLSIILMALHGSTIKKLRTKLGRTIHSSLTWLDGCKWEEKISVVQWLAPMRSGLYYYIVFPGHWAREIMCQMLTKLQTTIDTNNSSASKSLFLLINRQSSRRVNIIVHQTGKYLLAGSKVADVGK